MQRKKASARVSESEESESAEEEEMPAQSTESVDDETAREMSEGVAAETQREQCGRRERGSNHCLRPEPPPGVLATSLLLVCRAAGKFSPCASLCQCMRSCVCMWMHSMREKEPEPQGVAARLIGLPGLLQRKNKKSERVCESE